MGIFQRVMLVLRGVSAFTQNILGKILTTNSSTWITWILLVWCSEKNINIFPQMVVFNGDDDRATIRCCNKNYLKQIQD